MSNIRNIGLNELPQEVVLHKILFPHSDVKTIITFSGTNKPLNKAITKEIEGLWDREITYIDFPHRQFLQFIDGYRKMTTSFIEAENLFQKAKWLFSNYCTSSFFLRKHRDLPSHKNLNYEIYQIYYFYSPVVSSAPLNKTLGRTESLKLKILLSFVSLYPMFITSCIDGFLTFSIDAYNQLKGLPPSKFQENCTNWLKDTINCPQIIGSVHETANRYGLICGFIFGAAWHLILLIISLLLLNYIGETAFFSIKYLLSLN